MYVIKTQLNLAAVNHKWQDVKFENHIRLSMSNASHPSWTLYVHYPNLKYTKEQIIDVVAFKVGIKNILAELLKSQCVPHIAVLCLGECTFDYVAFDREGKFRLLKSVWGQVNPQDVEPLPEVFLTQLVSIPVGQEMQYQPQNFIQDDKDEDDGKN